MTDPIRILLTDDQALFRAGLRVVLDAQEDMVVVGEASDGAEALAAIPELRPDVVLLDMRMAGVDGVETVRRLFADDGPVDGPLPRVIVLTTFGLDPAAATAIRLGASGFLLKDTTPPFLFAAVRAVHEGSSVIAPNDLSQLFGADVERAPAPQPPAFQTLTDRERIVFGWASRGLSNAEIAAKEFVTESTVKTQISSILGKLALRDRVQLVVYAHDHGLAGAREP
ncbi:response regulator transcription factor [Curtobacterium flaccumfaciens pv. beticola]|uniref:response regulator n=1 Tax=Curtobacterium TaxID=2034 RepID=UPI0015811EDE|nr:response regulator transcription factor [Curtobacterium sp. Csp2]MCS5486154.1 response regulator transcription factor [Curtobacterium flaccumfaciens pv. basellae]QKS18012.1 response regulator transcription factor [Curtobacterium sp. Csp2]